jgi:hypothetical protein
MTLRWMGVAVGTAVAVAMSIVLALPGSSHSHAVTRAQILAFERAVDPLVTRGGQVVQEGMKPAVVDLDKDHVTPPAFIAHEADGWTATLSDVRRSIAAVKVASGLSAPRQTLVSALDMYVSAASTFKAAALAPAAQRKALITSGINKAQQADHIFDQAAAAIQAARRHLGLGASASFPDPGHD